MSPFPISAKARARPPIKIITILISFTLSFLNISFTSIDDAFITHVSMDERIAATRPHTTTAAIAIQIFLFL